MAVYKGNLAIDPRGMIYESYRIEAVTIEECRMIFLDWAMNDVPVGDMSAHLRVLLGEYEAANPADHPMTLIIKEGLAGAAGKKRRGGAARRRVVNDE